MNRNDNTESYGPRWEQELAPEIVQWAKGIFAALEEDQEYQDNLRVALKSDPQQVQQYYDDQRSGCCGFWDEERVGPDGQVYLLGCNYGH